MSFLEQHALWKQLGGYDPRGMQAKTADAIVLLEQEWKKESTSGEVE